MTETIGQALDVLFAQIEAKKDADPKISYSASLVQGGPIVCAKKLGEEAVELALALAGGKDEEIRNEAADLLYHLAAAIITAKINPDEIAQSLANRRAKSGHQEKADRKNA